MKQTSDWLSKTCMQKSHYVLFMKCSLFERLFFALYGSDMTGLTQTHFLYNFIGFCYCHYYVLKKRRLAVNCQGLGNIEKRKDVYHFLKSQNYNIYCLQDIHFTSEIESSIRSMWGFDCFFSSFSSNSRGGIYSV